MGFYKKISKSPRNKKELGQNGKCTWCSVMRSRNERPQKKMPYFRPSWQAHARYPKNHTF
eukprot:NODE_6087_length_532_cov_21.737060_g5331_i0.p3 GENE.NODE_6087_length_532_cov_21.737060_g5331_i0~~NODE_6087_length_532_cov_21.737060_g5331_i0.p3  ORF type:complete len:60 (+),score=0.32 NODE_6087_length_532_cov_21.737060_g5331_i0:141-320(+)